MHKFALIILLSIAIFSGCKSSQAELDATDPQYAHAWKMKRYNAPSPGGYRMLRLFPTEDDGYLNLLDNNRAEYYDKDAHRLLIGEPAIEKPFLGQWQHAVGNVIKVSWEDKKRFPDKSYKYKIYIGKHQNVEFYGFWPVSKK